MNDFLSITLVSLILFYWMIKWVIFVLFVPYIRKIGKDSYKVMQRERKESIVSPLFTAENMNKKRSFLFMVKGALRRMRDGYIRYMSFQVGLIPSHHIRKLIYKYVFMVNMADKVVVYWDCEIRGHGKLTIGHGSIIGDHTILDARGGGIDIGKNVNISNNVSLWTEQHDYNDPYFRSMPGRRGPIVIGDRVWIGPNVTILHSVTIGEGAVIAAGAVVTKDVAPYTLVGGIPAKVIGDRNKDLRYEFQGTHLHFY